MTVELIHDVEQLRRFHSLLAPLQDDEAYFLSMSVRKKYLTADERLFYELRNAEMFARKLVKDSSFETFLRTVRSLEVSEGGYTTKNNLPMPEKAMVVYAQINPVSGTHALREFQTKATDLMFDLPTNPAAKKQLARLDTLLMNCYQRSHGQKTLLDIDVDTDNFYYVERLMNELKLRDVEFEVIATRSGFHVLMRRETVKFNYHKMVTEIDFEMKENGDKGEVVVNKNYMVPLPGTYQAGTPVVMLEDL